MNNNTIAIVFTGVLMVAMLATPFISLAEAEQPTITDKGSYIEYVGSLDGANYVIRIPSPIEKWNGMLIVGCHGYAYYPPWNPNYQFAFDAMKDTTGKSFTMNLVEQGFAYAASSYGEGGYEIQNDMIRTHQLTEYVIDNFHITGKVFLAGLSMGGTVALLLGEKYPDQYSGVLDIVGGKDLVTRYYYIQAALQMNPWTYPVPKAFFEQWYSDILSACGGTPTEKPQSYERFSATSHADIEIPVVSIHGSLDILLPPSQALSYGDAVAQAGCSQFYKAYMIEGGGHGTPNVIDAAETHFSELVSYPTGW